MSAREASGAAHIVAALEALGVSTVFTVPGSQNIALIEAFRRSKLRTVVGTDEMAVAFMAGAYARVVGGLGVVTTIPGPGFTYALSGLAEARADSAAVLYLGLTVSPTSRPFTLQRLAQQAIAAPLVKGTFSVTAVSDLGRVIAEGARLALAGEPGPVLIDIPAELLRAIGSGALSADPSQASNVDPLAPLAGRLRQARRPLFFLGQGARDAADAIRSYAERSGAPIVTTCSGRGVVDEDHPLVCYRDFSFGTGTIVPGLIERADLVVAVGCKLSHNGTGSFALPFDGDRFVHVDPSQEVLDAGYPGGLRLRAPATAVATMLRELPDPGRGWTEAEVAVAKEALRAEHAQSIPFPPSVEGRVGSLERVFEQIHAALPHNRIVVTDSGYHQGLTRTHSVVHRPAGMLTPADFQSMGFGLPAAVAAKIADPTATVVCCIGDGGLAMSSGELLTAVRERIDLIVLLFNNRRLGLIEQSQLREFGHGHGTRLENPDFSRFADSMGITHHDGNHEPGAAVRAALAAGGVHLIELRLGAGHRLRTAQAVAIAKGAAGGWLSPAWRRRLRAWVGRRRRP